MRNQSGIALIELLVALIVMTIFFSIVIPKYNNIIARVHIEANKIFVHNVQIAHRMAYLGEGRYPKVSEIKKELNENVLVNKDSLEQKHTGYKAFTYKDTQCDHKTNNKNDYVLCVKEV